MLVPSATRGITAQRSMRMPALKAAIVSVPMAATVRVRMPMATGTSRWAPVVGRAM